MGESNNHRIFLNKLFILTPSVSRILIRESGGKTKDLKFLSVTLGQIFLIFSATIGIVLANKSQNSSNNLQQVSVNQRQSLNNVRKTSSFTSCLKSSTDSDYSSTNCQQSSINSHQSPSNLDGSSTNHGNGE